MWSQTRKRFTSDDAGSIAIIFALSLVPLVGLVGVATDYSRAAHLRTALRAETDAAALLLASAGAAQKKDLSEKVLGQVRQRIAANYAGQLATELELQGAWLNATDFQVTARTAIANNVLKAIPSLATQTPVGAVAVARLAEAAVAGATPRVAQLDPEAGDYNRIYAYCYKAPERKDKDKDKDKDKKASVDDPASRRSQMTPIADNGGTYYSSTMPSCKADEVMSYRLYNVRGARTSRQLWDNPSAERYNYYSDTTVSGSVQTTNFEDNVEILETIICPTLASCKPRSQGGMLPEGKNRNPQTATGACSPGKFMYYGWEDRPPGRGWTDRDFDDIRVIVECPTAAPETSKQVWLIR